MSAQQLPQVITKLVHFGIDAFELVDINTHHAREASHLNQKMDHEKLFYAEKGDLAEREGKSAH